MRYLVQIDGTNPKNWREINATNREDAIVQAIRPLIKDGHTPEIAYTMLGEARHPNGAPICVQSHKLFIKREAKQ